LHLLGYRDIIAIPDLSTFRRIPWENNIPFFLLSFFDPATREPLAVCPRGVLKKVTDELASMGWEAMCGAELEFFNFKGNKDNQRPLSYPLWEKKSRKKTCVA